MFTIAFYNLSYILHERSLAVKARETIQCYKLHLNIHPFSIFKATAEDILR